MSVEKVRAYLEHFGVSDRILVMHDLHFTGGLDKGEATQEKLLALAVQ